MRGAPRAPVPEGDAAPLELNFFASGATQHVFLRADDPEDGWVYKIPALIDAHLPSRVSMARHAPTRRSMRLIHALLYSAPRDLWRSLARLQRLPLAAPLARHYLGFMNRKLAEHLRRSRVAAFERIVEIHRSHAEDGAVASALLPCRVLPHSRAVLHTEGVRHHYRGPVLVQRRADLFFEDADGVERFDGSALVAIQHRLWRHGIALADGAGALGPHGWALLEGQLRLGDTGSLTRDRNLAERVLAPALLRAVEESEVRRHDDPGARERVRSYYAWVRSEINPERLGELWEAEGRRPGRTSRPARSVGIRRPRRPPRPPW